MDSGRSVRAIVACICELTAQMLSSPRDFLNKAGLVAARRPYLRILFEKIGVRPRMPIGVVPGDFDDRITRVTPGNRTARSQLRILYFVNSGLPHTSSGYTLRTQALLESIDHSKTVVMPVTRLGYPASIGKIVSNDFTFFGGVRYLHLLPLPAPVSRSKRVDRTVKLLSRFVEDQDIDILHTTTDFRNAAIISQVANLTGRPWVYEVRGERDESVRAALESRSDSAQMQTPEKMREKENVAMQSANVVIALSDVSARSLEQRGVEPNRISVVPNGVSQPPRAPNSGCVRDWLGIQRDRIVVGTVTSVVAYEGLDILILALEHLPPEFHLLIVGDGDALQELERLVKERGLEARVTFAGKQSAETIIDWYAALDVFAIPRKDFDVCRRVTPLKPLQAMQVGVPIVASDLPALREATGGFACFVEPESPPALADGILRAAREQKKPEVMKEMRRFVESRTWEASARKLQSIYEGLS